MHPMAVVVVEKMMHDLASGIGASRQVRMNPIHHRPSESVRHLQKKRRNADEVKLNQRSVRPRRVTTSGGLLIRLTLLNFASDSSG